MWRFSVSRVHPLRYRSASDKIAGDAVAPMPAIFFSHSCGDSPGGALLVHSSLWSPPYADSRNGSLGSITSLSTLGQSRLFSSRAGSSFTRAAVP